MTKIICKIIVILLVFSSCVSKNDSAWKPVFETIVTQSDASIRALHVVNESVVWAGGSGGTVLLSTNAGQSWTINRIPGAETNDFRSIHAWDENRALVFGVLGPNFAYKTIDGGNSWQPVYGDTTHGLFFNSVKFADTQNGLAISDPVDGKFFLLRTNNGGDTWQSVHNLPDVIAGEANFAASNTCIEFLPSGHAWIASGGSAARVFYSEDFGENWEVAKTPMIRGQASAGIFSVACKNNRFGIIVGGIYDNPGINTNIAAYTNDGGRTWLPAMQMPQQYRSCVQFVSNGKENLAFAIGKTGCDISNDAGVNWHFAKTVGYYTFRPIPGELAGFAAGANGKMAKVEFVKK